jgi:mono/diheme cytochrome c family protein
MSSTTPLLRSLLATLALVSLGHAPVFAAGDAKENWAQFCSRCHGPDGKGNTKMGRKLSIKDLTQAKVQTRLSDDRIAEAIAEGDQDNDGNERMPSFRDKLSEAERRALVDYIRTLAADRS